MDLELITYSISDIGKVITGKTPPAIIKSAYSALDGVPFVTPKDMDGRRWIENTERYLTSDGVAAVKRNLVPAMSVAVSCIGSDMGKATLLKKESVTNQQINSIVIDVERFNPKYIYYVLSTKQQYFKDIAGGSATPILNKTDFGKITFQAPSKYYQDLIAEYLDCLDSKHELNRQINQTLEQMAQALFKSWFVDFDPVIDNALDAGFFEQDLDFPDELLRRAEARRAVREHGAYLEKSKLLPDAIRQLFPAAFEECAEPSVGLGGWVPKGWGAKNLTTLVDTISKTYPLKTVDEVIFLNTGDIEDGRFLHSDYSEVAGLPGQAKKSIQRDDILFSEIRPKNKRFAYVNFETEHHVVSTKLMVLRAKENVHPLFAYFLLTLENTTTELQRIAELRSGTFPQITYNELALISLCLPNSSNLIEVFVSSYLQPFYDRSFKLRDENEKLTSLRDTLLPKLISGELRLDNIATVLAKEGVA